MSAAGGGGKTVTVSTTQAHKIMDGRCEVLTGVPLARKTDSYDKCRADQTSRLTRAMSLTAAPGPGCRGPQNF